MAVGDSCREIERVLQGQFAGTDGLRIKTPHPLLAIDRMIEMSDRPVVFKQAAAPNVAEEVIGLNFVGRIVGPGLGVADSRVEGIELGLGSALVAGSIQGKASMRRR